MVIMCYFTDMMESTVVDPDPLNLDLSHLSIEERALIQNVMVKAKNMEVSEPITPVPLSAKR